MDELKDLQQRLEQERPASWSELPDLALYMDQVISYMPRQLIQFQEGDGLTSAMVNNYIKDGLLPRAEGKRYHAIHLAYLTAICAMKRVLSVKDMKVLLTSYEPERPPEVLYESFRTALDEALRDTAASLEGVEEENLTRLALQLALRSYADQLACTRVLDILRQRTQPPQAENRKEEKRREKEEKHREKGRPEE